MPAGQRRERLTFQQRRIDGNGDRLGDWEDPGLKRWGRVVSRTRGEVALEQRLQSLQPAEVTITNDSGSRSITTAWRMVWGGVAYNIQAIASTENKAELTLLVQADQTDG